MSEYRYRVETYKVDYLCDSCGDVMHFTGSTIGNRYVHKCSLTHKIYLNEPFPVIRYREAEIKVCRMNEPDTTDGVAKAIREEYDGNTEIEQCGDYGGDQAFGYRQEALIAIRADREELAKQGYVICKKVSVDLKAKELTKIIGNIPMMDSRDQAFAAIEYFRSLGLPIELTDD